MNEFLQKAEAFIAAAETKAIDAATQGTAALRQLADYLDGQIAGLKSATPDSAKKCVELAAKCKALCPSCDHAENDPHAPKGFGLPGNPILMALLQLLEVALTSLSQPTPAPTPAA